MKSARSPPWKKETPSNNPDLLEVWEEMYNELIAVYPKSRSLEIIGNRYGVSRQCVMYHLFPAYKDAQKKRPSKKWSYEKSVPEIHQKRVDYKRKYQAARYHIDDLIRESYKQASLREALTLEDLSYVIHDISNIFFKPETVLGLVKRFETTKGCSVLEEVPGYQMPHYRLSNESKK